MFEKIINHSYIFLSIMLAVASQLIMRWQASSFGAFPLDFRDKFFFLFYALLNPWILLAFLFTFFSGIAWLLAMTKFELSYAYPFVSLHYVFILFASSYLLNESITLYKLVGSLTIVLGVLLISKG